MKALVVNALGGGFDLDDIDIAAPIGREVLIDVQASGVTPIYCSLRTISRRFQQYSAMRSPGSSPRLARMSHNSARAIMSWARLCNRVDRARDASPAAPSSVSTRKQRCGGRGRRRASSRHAAVHCSRAWDLVASPNARSSTTRTSSALVPKDMPFAQAALLELRRCHRRGRAGLEYRRRAPPATRSSFSVPGASGLLRPAAHAHRRRGSRIVAIDLQPKRLEAAKQFGATSMCNRFHQGRSG